MAHVVTQTPVGPEPATMVCPHCQNHMTTVVERQPTTKTHLFCLLFSFIGCFLCAPFVYCTDSCLATSHSCPKCQQYLGTYER